ncbi:MAG TPA: hypothetical protein VG900_05825 [Hyphomicrobiaceae bacterium]|jgi:hypothetical protein|nr:hypothetical protein [Hyphomicrobiaceae bacterium]
MSSVVHEERLLVALRQVWANEASPFTAIADGPSGVLILNNGHCRGVWSWREGAYNFTPGGYGASTYAALTHQEAVRFTIDHVCRQ